MTDTKTPTAADNPSSSPSEPGCRLPICSICGSDRVVRDSWAVWNPIARDWELEDIFDHTFCLACETDAKLEWRTTTLTKTERIRRQNDALRTGKQLNGQVMITSGVQALGSDFVTEVWKAVATFTDFNTDNDPHGEHDFGTVTVQGEKLFFKIDTYDLTMSAHSPDAADPQVTKRVITIMLASEY